MAAYPTHTTDKVLILFNRKIINHVLCRFYFTHRLHMEGSKISADGCKRPVNSCLIFSFHLSLKFIRQMMILPDRAKLFDIFFRFNRKCVDCMSCNNRLAPDAFPSGSRTESEARTP